MAHIRVINWHRKWPRPGNHLDGRICPDCGATAHGWPGQRAHQEWHEQSRELLIKLCQRTGIAEEEVELPWSWSATVEGHAEAPEPIEEAADGL
jgi:hypothetical protein